MGEKQWTISAILKWTKQYFEGKGLATPRLDAEVLLSYILGKDRLYLYVNFDQPLQPEELGAFREVVKKRAARVPVAYITGKKEFMGLSFKVSPAVLIPRPETEFLVETVLGWLSGVDSPVIVDLGTGSGAIIISLLSKKTFAKGVAVDISEDALVIAAKNAIELGVSDRLTLVQGDLFAAVPGGRFDVIVSNPPYIAAGDMADLSPEVKYEPALALNGGIDGLDFYRRIVDNACLYLKEKGVVVLEAGAGQAQAVAALAVENSGLKAGAIIRDYAGIERVVVLERR